METADNAKDCLCLPERTAGGAFISCGGLEIIGVSSGLREALSRCELVAPTDCTTLISGETGTGKELLAKTIHEISGRRHHSFVPVNCAAVPVELLESELFGHERGAFTGAVVRRLGRFEVANKGTIFLD